MGCQNIKAGDLQPKIVEYCLGLRLGLYLDLHIVATFGQLQRGKCQNKAKKRGIYQHSTKLPSCRDALWYGDGTKLNYFYLEDGKIKTCQVYEVMDAYSEVLLGYCISEKEDYQAQYSAFKMAIENAGHRPYQITVDNQGGHKKLETGNFLSKICRIAIKTQPYNPNSKTIESVFRRLQKILSGDWFFTGQNITAKRAESRANMEFILANRASLPSLEEIKKSMLSGARSGTRRRILQAAYPESRCTKAARTIRLQRLLLPLTGSNFRRKSKPTHTWCIKRTGCLILSG